MSITSCGGGIIQDQASHYIIAFSSYCGYYAILETKLGLSWMKFHLLVDLNYLSFGWRSNCLWQFTISLMVEDHAQFKSFLDKLNTISLLIVILFLTLIARGTRRPIQSLLGLVPLPTVWSFLTFHDNFELLYRKIDMDFLVLDNIILTFICLLCIESGTSILITSLHMLHLINFGSSGLHPFICCILLILEVQVYALSPHSLCSHRFVFIHAIGESRPPSASPIGVWKPTKIVQVFFA